MSNPETNNRKQTIVKLEALAEDIRAGRKNRKRPLIVEFSGLPKSGKTTAANAVALFLRRNGIKAQVVAERASVCPIRNKLHPYFNVWTGCMTLANILEAVDSHEADVLVIDRGLFDLAIWMRWLVLLGELSKPEYSIITEFFLMERWRNMVDVVVFMECDVETALDREFKNLLTDKEGSIMNRRVLNEYLEAAKTVVKDAKEEFNHLECIDTTDSDISECLEQITMLVLESLEQLSDEELAVLPVRAFVQEIGVVGFNADGAERLLSLLEEPIPMRRSEAEGDPDMLQVVPIVVIRSSEAVLLFKKYEVGGVGRHHKKSMVWAGGHLRYEDVGGARNGRVLTALKRCLEREIKEEINYVWEPEMTLRGIIYDNTHPKSLQHVGVVFEMTIDEPDKWAALENRVFPEPGGPKMMSVSVPLTSAAFAEYSEKLEPWSVEIIRCLYGVEIEQSEAVQTILPI